MFGETELDKEKVLNQNKGQQRPNFVCNLFSWAKSSIVVGPLTLFNFVDWLGSC